MDKYRGNEGIIGLILDSKTKIFDKYKKIKVILTTRLKATMPDKLCQPISENYIRLLPFEEPQINEYLRFSDVGLTYRQLRNMGLGVEE